VDGNEDDFIIQLRHLSGKEIPLKKLLTLIFLSIFTLSACSSLVKSAASADGALEIHDIQGCSHVSPYNGRNVSKVRGVVTWKVAKGFFIQAQTPDDEDCSSEGIFVFTGNYANVIPGDLVTVDGRVAEFVSGDSESNYLSTTEIEADNVELLSENIKLPDPVIIGRDGRVPPDKVIEDDAMKEFDPISDGLDFYESLEGMLVQVKDARVVEATNSYDEIFVIPADLAEENLLSSQGALILTESDSNPERIFVKLPDSYQKALHLGDHIENPITGVIDYQYGNYCLIETNQITQVTSQKSKNSPPDEIGAGALRLASYNVNNFNRFEDNKLKTLADQIVHDLGLPDILVLQEVQDDSGLDDDGVTSAVKNLNALIGMIYDESEVMYKFVDPKVDNNSTGGAAGGNIRTVILYRGDRGLELGDLPGSINTNASEFSNSRRPTVAKFSFQSKTIYVIGVHFVSNNLNSPLYGSIQPIEKLEESKRIAQAKWVASLVSQLQKKENIAGVIVAGDFNDVPWSSTLKQFESVDMFNANAQIPTDENYSFIFEGNASTFDQILISNGLVDSLSAISVIHLNTSLPEEKQISDHDPVLIDLKP
jgi:uncharacterized protein